MKLYQTILIILILATRVAAQTTFGDLGMAGASGIAMVPTVSVAPPASLRIHAGRMEFMNSGLFGYNIFGFQAGLSTNLETYITINSEQTGSISSLFSYTLGGKLLLPFHVPVVSSVALVCETSSSADDLQSGFIPRNQSKVSAIVNPAFGKVNPVIFFGSMKVNKAFLPIAGIGASYPFGESIKLGSEVYYNYYGMREQQGLISVGMKVFSNIGLQINGGYLNSEKISSWIISGGVSLATADFNLYPKLKTPPKAVVPSFEEMEQISTQEKGIGGLTIPPLPEQSDKTSDRQQEQTKENKDDPNKKH